MAAGDSHTIRRTVELTEQDVVDANLLWARRHAVSPLGLKTAAICGLIVGLIGLIGGDLSAPMLARTAIIALAVALAVVPLTYAVNRLYMPSRARRFFREQAALQRPAEFLADPVALTVTQQDFFARVPWGELIKWAEGQSGLLVFTTRLTFYILPRRVFPDVELGRIRAWLEAAGVPSY